MYAGVSDMVKLVSRSYSIIQKSPYVHALQDPEQLPRKSTLDVEWLLVVHQANIQLYSDKTLFNLFYIFHPRSTQTSKKGNSLPYLHCSISLITDKEAKRTESLSLIYSTFSFCPFSDCQRLISLQQFWACKLENK